MSLKQYIKNLPPPEREAFAQRVGTTVGHLRNIGYGLSPCAPKLAVAIAKQSAGAVTRQMLCPDDYWEIWPELSPPPGVEPVVLAKRRRPGRSAVVAGV